MSALSCVKNSIPGEISLSMNFIANFTIVQDHSIWTGPLKRQFSFTASAHSSFFHFHRQKLCHFNVLWTFFAKFLVVFGSYWQFSESSVVLNTNGRFHYQQVLLTGTCLLLSKWKCFLIYNVNKMLRPLKKKKKTWRWRISGIQRIKRETEEESMTWLVKAFKLILWMTFLSSAH